MVPGDSGLQSEAGESLPEGDRKRMEQLLVVPVFSELGIQGL